MDSGSESEILKVNFFFLQVAKSTCMWTLNVSCRPKGKVTQLLQDHGSEATGTIHFTVYPVYSGPIVCPSVFISILFEAYMLFRP
jgi:hypothetical protein